MTHELPFHLSVSQRDEFLDCSWKYALKRVLRVPERPGLALVGGKAFHWVTELIDHRLEAPLESPRSVPGDMVKFPVSEREATSAGGESSHSDPKTPLYANLTRQVVGEIDWGKVDLEAPVTDEVAEAWHLALSTEVLAESERNTLFPDPKDWKAAGRVSKALPAGEDLNWWTSQGALQLQSYLRWRLTSGWQLAYFGGNPMIELDVSTTIRGIPISGYLDRIMIDPNGVAVLVDLKSSRTEPSSSSQLGTYKLALEALGMPAPTYGAYFMSRDGVMGRPRDLTRYTEDYFAWQYGVVKRQRDAGEFVANDKSAYCAYCTFREHCYAVGGPKADELPKPWELTAPKVKIPLEVVGDK